MIKKVEHTSLCTWVYLDIDPDESIRQPLRMLGFVYSGKRTKKKKVSSAWYSGDNTISEAVIRAAIGSEMPTESPTTMQTTTPAGNPRMAEKFRKMADSYDQKIRDKRNTFAGATITHRRAGFIASANKEADQMEDAQALMRELADIWEAETPEPFLASLKYKKTFEALVGMRWKGDASDDASEETFAWAKSVLAGGNTERAKRNRMRELKTAVRLANIPGFFPTPNLVQDHMMTTLWLPDGALVWEPNAGDGQLAKGIAERFPTAKIECCEVNYRLRELLELQGFELVGDDMLEHTGQYDAVIMNPPFENGQDIAHVRHAYNQLKAGGKLRAIMGAGAFHRSDKQAIAFREWLDEVGGYTTDLPDGSFKESGTGVAAKVVYIDDAIGSPF